MIDFRNGIRIGLSMPFNFGESFSSNHDIDIGISFINHDVIVFKEVNEETGEAIMYHTSNKMTSKDQIANGSPAKEIREITSLGGFDNEEQEQQAAEAGEETRKIIEQAKKDSENLVIETVSYTHLTLPTKA